LAASAHLEGGATVRRAVFVILAILLLAIVGRFLLPDTQGRPLAPPQRAPTTAAPLNYDAALAQADQQVDGARLVAAQNPGEWLHLERLALAYIVRARLTGSFDDYAARRLLSTRRSPTPTGPRGRT
jgi:cytochrome c-type biogenesis protein CcmH/NrfG